ncbi:PTS fructose transporter subunit IIABC [Georgenia muralis]|uniref:PTS system D-fructose-specific IIA component (F1P-forming) (Frc family) /PTS system D-fructose-specific IIB component (F1P-forming) (Frc family) /PTS system D-fructose-specific IIC component (F1P-f... n=1 Tax=Georgenia muralis TaxID=154117 RepID=A0A3N4Z432_9MICO|nr:fructose-specific PTS transporter subunit EIIC [Georgenia muralis]RPF27257.1 PTS system D-fructose-specific IIA component (F1P-forming) (Frc family) /PTS system D-fructose-specific IIB component (F1P-forming) (Frc family) /PTS system D-fructose-specific IIC component (F1P-forming) (Frc family) [Georgenia muralis]
MSAETSGLITPDLVTLDADLGSTKDQVIAALAARVAAAGRADAAGLTADALEREGKSATGLPGGIAIPHCRSTAVSVGSLAFARLDPKVDFGAPDGPAELVFLIAAAEGTGSEHMKLLTKLARALVKKDFVAALRGAGSAEEVVALVEGVVNPPAAAPASGAVGAAPSAGTAPAGSVPATADTSAPPGAAPAAADGAATRRIVAITACPTGIAHTYMAADALVAAGQEAGVTVEVETQGSGATTPLSAATIASADAVIFATDVGVKGKERFAGKPVIESGVKRAINEPGVMITEALRAADDPSSRRVSGTAADAGAPAAAGGLGIGSRLKQALLTGVSYMIPFVAAGGLIIALGFLFGGYDIVFDSADIVVNNSLTNLPEGGLATYLGAVFHQLGAAAFAFLVPALAGYIAFAIADRPGIAPGFTAGAVAVFVGAGFIGGLIGGLLAGVAALWISRITVPRWLRGLMPVVIIPLVATVFAGGLMFVVLGQPLAAVTTGLSNWLGGLSGTSAVILGVILGLMMTFDLGGPVNKAAYAFATAGLVVTDPATLRVMAAVMAAGMVPPLAMALATVVRPKLFTEVERENGSAAWLLGASFISEGAIPFAAADPLRVIPSMMAGGAVTGAIAMAFDAQSRAPHGGIFVFFAMSNVLAFVGAIVAGMLVSATLVILAKEFVGRTADEPAQDVAVAAV